MSYATVQEYKDYMSALTTSMPVNFNAAEDSFIADLLDEATRFIEDETKRKFEQFYQVRYYLSSSVVYHDPQLLLVDEDLLSVETLTNADGSVINSSEYWLEPMNSTPHHGIRLKSTKTWVWPLDGRVSVSGVWGYMSSPDRDVKRVTMRLAYIFMQRRSSAQDIEVLSAGGQVGATMRYGSYIPQDIWNWIARHKRVISR